MMTLRNGRAKKIEVNLNFLRNDLDIWNHRVISWLDAKSQPQQNEIEKFGIEVVQKLCKREILKTRDIYMIYGMKFPERPLTPWRSGSASPNRPTTPDSPSSRLKSITRDSPKDRHHDCQKKLDLDDDEDGYKVNAYNATCTCAHDETLYQCRISVLEKQKIKIEKELQRFESLANEYIFKFRDLKKTMDSSSPVEGRSDTENENIRLRCELTEALENIEKIRQEFAGLSQKLSREEANKYSAYEVLQNKNDLETCKHQKKALEDERNELQNENIELENELQSLNTKREQFDDTARNKSNLKKHIKDLEERNTGNKVHEVEEMMQKLQETAQEQEQENRDLIGKLENLNKEKKDLEDRLRVIGFHYKEELDQKKEEIDKIQRDKEKYMVCKDEMSKFKKDNAEMKQKLQNLSTQLKESENRLGINNYEKSSIIKENKELKNILQEKLSEVKRLETRLLQYADKCTDIQAQKRHMAKLQSENDELYQKCKNLQTVEKNVQKLKKEKQQLETEMISQRQNIVTLNSRVKIVNDGKLELEERLRLQIDNIEKSSILKENKELKSVKNRLQEKLSEVKRLETSVQQYAETMEYIPVLKRHMDKLQKDNDELNQKCTHLQKVVKDVQKLSREKIQLETDNISQRQDNETLNSRLEMLNVEKLEIEDRLRLQDDEVELLFNSLETERQEHESAMKKLEMLYVAVQNECVELLLKLQKIHSSSEISFEKLNSVIDKDIFGQKLEETTAQENTLAKDTTKILENFASAKDKKGCIEVLKKRFEKSLPKCDNGISSAEKTDMEDNTSNSSCTKYYEETVKERKSTCHNRIHRTTNVTNFNIAGSNVSFNENTQQLSRLNGNNGQFPAIEEGN